ncbi:MAG: acyl transferase [Bacteroidetes bacterium]|nr:acyl transferase [Bacteroidota bacterium]
METDVFAIRTEDDFNRAALDVFRYQVETNSIYRRYVHALNRHTNDIVHYKQIPCIPIEFFKTADVFCGQTLHEEICFTSSATTGMVVSKHHVQKLSLYETSFLKAFELFYSDVRDYCILALLPGYLERSGSSLVYMAEKLIQLSGQPESGFFLHDHVGLIHTIQELNKQNRKFILLGVTYALLDLAENNLQLGNNAIVMETGGMKGKRREMVREELHAVLCRGLGVKQIHSEYGMTELLSQGYSSGGGLFATPPWMKVLIRDTNDPFTYVDAGRSGGINVIDLANLYSCAFIETKDLGKTSVSGRFEVLGRFDNSDIRGCNLLVQ